MNSANEVVADSRDDDRRLDDDDHGEPIAEAAFAEFDDRQRACGAAAGGYPFRVTNNALTLHECAESSLYVFLALLSWSGKVPGPLGPTGTNSARRCGKGRRAKPRQSARPCEVVGIWLSSALEPKGFAAVLDHLCEILGEGQGHHKGRPTLPNQKDGKLDVVAWRAFADQREGKIITFGQCATGRDWETKITELPQPHKWCAHWMTDSPVVDPIRSFFVPHRVEQSDWSHKSRLGGILYDRCRIASLAPADERLRDEWAAWSLHVLQRVRGN